MTFGEGNGTPLQYSCLENLMDGGARMAAVHGVTGSRTRLSDFRFTFHIHALEKEMATHSSVLAWRIPGMGEPGGLPSMGSHRVGHDWRDLAAAAAAAAGNPLYSLTCRFLHSSTYDISLCSWLSQILPFYKETSTIGLEPTIIAYFNPIMFIFNKVTSWGTGV